MDAILQSIPNQGYAILNASTGAIQKVSISLVFQFPRPCGRSLPMSSSRLIGYHQPNLISLSLPLYLSLTFPHVPYMWLPQATGELEGEETSLQGLYSIFLDSIKSIGSEPFHRLSVSYTTHSYVVTLGESGGENFVYVLKSASW